MSDEEILKKLEVPDLDNNELINFEDLPFYNQMIDDNELFIEETFNEFPQELGYAQALQDSLRKHFEELKELSSARMILGYKTR